MIDAAADRPPVPSPTADQRRQLRKFAFGALGGALIGGVGMFALVKSGIVAKGGGAGRGPDLALLDFVLFYAWFVGATVVHELGHVLGGRLGGMRFLMFVVPPLKIARTPRGLKASFVFKLGGLGGFASSMPDPDRPLRAQMIPLIVGGPLASLALASAAAAAAIALEGRLATHALVLAGIATLQFLVSAIPSRLAGMMSDGWQLRSMLRGGREVEQRTIVTALTAASYAGTRPREIDAMQLERALGLVPGEFLFDVSTHYYAYARALDRGDVAGATPHLDRIEAAFPAYPQGFRQAWAIELAYFEAAHRRDAVRARAWLAHAKGGVTEPYRAALAEAALARLEGRDAEADAAIARARAALANPVSIGAAAMTADQLDALEREPVARAA